jgi:hypothetical protein
MSTVFEAGVVITLVDRVSGALGRIAKQFATTNTAAAALQNRMNRIGNMWNSGLLMVSTGTAIARPIIAATREAEKYQHQINQMTSAGMSHLEMVRAIGSAWETTNNITTSGAVQNLKIISDLRGVFGQTQEAIEYMPKFSKMQGAYSSILDGKLVKRAEEQSFALAKALDMVGKVSNRAEFNKAADSIFKVTEATIGRVLPSDYQQFYKFARQARYGLNDDFAYKILPELILENKGGNSLGNSMGGPGAAVAALYRFGVQGIMNKRSAEMLRQMGMVPAASILKTTTSGTTLSGGVLGSGVLAKNPFEWVQTVFLPHLESRFKISSTETDKLIQTSNQVFKGNQLASSLVAEFIRKKMQLTRFSGLWDKTDSIDQAYARGMKNDPAANWEAFHRSIENLKIALGESVVPVIIPIINKLSSTIQQTAKYLHDHPGIAKALVGITALTSAALILGGVFNIASAGFMGLRLMVFAIGAGVGGLTGVLSGVLKAVMMFGRILPILGAALVSVALLTDNWDRIMGFVHQHSRVFVTIAAEVVRAMSNLAIGVRYLLNSLQTAFEQISSVGGLLRLPESWSRNIGGFFSKLMPKIDDVTAKRNEEYLKKRGLGGLVDSIKGTPVNMRGTADFIRSSVPNNMTKIEAPMNITINGAGLDEKKIVALIQAERDDFGKYIAKKASRAASGGSGNSVNRGINQGGNVKP